MPPHQTPGHLRSSALWAAGAAAPALSLSMLRVACGIRWSSLGTMKKKKRRRSHHQQQYLQRQGREDNDVSGSYTDSEAIREVSLGQYQDLHAACGGRSDATLPCPPPPAVMVATLWKEWMTTMMMLRCRSPHKVTPLQASRRGRVKLSSGGELHPQWAHQAPE